MATYALVEDLSTTDTTALIEGRTYPLPCLVEDPDGLRLLLLPPATSEIPLGLWQRAHAAGAALLVCVEDGEGIYSVLSVEAFLDRRTENQRTQSYGVAGWQGFIAVEPPTYRGLLEHHQEREQAANETVGTFVHVHTHSEYSQLDGLSRVSEIVTAVVADGQDAVCFTDHGNVAVHPEAQEECDKAGIKAVFGMEAYLVPDRHRRGTSWFEDEHGNRVDPANLDDEAKKRLVKKSDAQQALNEYTHICLWAMDQEGLRNLWALSTEGYREGFYGKPRIDWESLTRLNAGIIASTGCLRGPVSHPLIDGNHATATENLGRLASIFGDRLYVEIHTNHLEEQIRVNHLLVEMARGMGLPLLAAVDSHYACEDDKETHRAWLAMQTNKDLTDDTSLFAGGQDYHLKTEAEVRKSLEYLDPQVVDEAVHNTVVLASRCNARVEGAVTTPTFSKASKEHPDPVRRDVQRLIELCLSNWQRKVIGKRQPESVYMERFEREMKLLIDKAFCGYFLVVADYVGWAKSQGCLVGPGRGSGGGSLVAYLANIVEIDPVDADLLFERFLTEGRTSLPDFDIDFPATWRERLKDYVRSRWGEENVVTIGTITRLQSKGAFNDSARVLKPTLPYEVSFTDANLLKKAIDAADAPLAGKHLPWDEFCDQFSDLVDPLRAKYPEVFHLTDRVLGRVKTYGKHAAGVVISTGKSLADLPMRADKDGNMVTQFDMVALERLGYVKFDLLTLRTLDTIQVAMDLVRERFGIEINVYDWKDEYADPQVWDEICAGRTLGLFQVETRAGTRLVRRYQPHSLHDLAAVMTLVRPGPVRSGLTETYLRRRAGQEAVTFPEPRLEQVLGDTYGCIIYQEDIMQTCIVLAGYDGNEADEVRSILGKKKVEKIVPAGRMFQERAAANHTDPAVSAALWEQMAEFAKYSFNKAHAFGYSVLGFWTAWFKFHFPIQFLTAALSTVDDDRIPEFITESKRMGYGIQTPDINESGVVFTPGQTTVRYGLSSIRGIGEPTAKVIVSGQPYASLEDFIDRMVTPKGSKVDRGDLAALVAVGAFDSLIPNRRAVEIQLEAEASGAARTCVFMDRNVLGPGGLPCTFDWANEPDAPMIKKGRGKDQVLEPKPPPKRCTAACRQYRKPEPVDVSLVMPYTPDDIRNKERELLGVWVSSTPFDRLDPEGLDLAATAEEIEQGDVGIYYAAAIIEQVKVKTDVRGGRYAFVTFNAQNGSLDTICFSDQYAKYQQDLRPDALVALKIAKNDRGLQLLELAVPPT